MSESNGTSHRLIALDWMRGLVMVLMALDHSSMFYNSHRFALDSVLFYEGQAIDGTQFFVRWITHLCAPTFVFLAGTAIALSAMRRAEKNEPAGVFDRHLLIRGLILVLLDLAVLSSVEGMFLFQVLYAIGAGMLAMILLRRLSVRWIVGLGLGWIVLGEAIVSLIWSPAGGNAPIWLAPFAGVHESKSMLVIYPALPWLGLMMLGWGFGVFLHRSRKEQTPGRPIRLLLGCALVGLVTFAVVRGFNGYGNMSMFRSDGTWIQWLFMSKYPPSLSYVALELSLMALGLAGALWIGLKLSSFGHKNGPLIVFGQSALFFYLLHFLALSVSAGVMGAGRKGGLGKVFLVTLVLLLVLYPICRWYRNYKASHPKSIARFI